jgi:hypothetical protein
MQGDGMAVVVKTVGASGQISLGKKYAGRTVIIEQIEEGVWNVKTAQIIPDNELWLYSEHESAKLEEAIRWAEEHPPMETDLSVLEQQVEAGTKP